VFQASLRDLAARGIQQRPWFVNGSSQSIDLVRAVACWLPAGVARSALVPHSGHRVWAFGRPLLWLRLDNNVFTSVGLEYCTCAEFSLVLGQSMSENTGPNSDFLSRKFGLATLIRQQ
jgi:hypothetical protein